MSERKHVLRLYFAWNDEKEERWLEQMARSGWHLVNAAILYTFEKGMPAEVRYRVDYPPQQKSSVEEYVKLCRDAGWDRVCEFCGWQYFRTASQEAPEIYTDTASRIAKYRRLLAFSLLLAVTTVGANFSSLLDSSSGPRAHMIFLSVIRWIVVFLLCAWVYILTRLAIHIRVLKHKAGAGGKIG